MIALTRFVRGMLTAASATLFLGAAAHAQDSFKVGSTPSGVPFTFLDIKTNQIDGIMVDIVKAIGAEEGFTPQVEATQWSALIPSLTANKIDMIAAAMLATPERAKVVTFSDTVYSYGEGLFVKKDDAGSYTSWDDLEGKIAGVQVGTAYVDPITNSGKFKEVRIYDSIPDIMRDVALGRIDAGFADRPIVAYQLTGDSKAGVRLVPEYESQILGSVGIAVRQSDTDLLARLNSGIGKIKTSGELDRILQKWGVQ